MNNRLGPATMRLHQILPEYAACDEVAAYIAEALMALALEFESNHLAQIRRHYQSITPPEDDGQLDLFDEDPPF